MKILLTLFAFFFILKADASILTAVVSGDWDEDATWDSTAPGCYDTIHIPHGITVTITSTENYEGCGPMIILVDGELKFQSGKKIKLPCGATAVIIREGGELNGGGGGGNSNNIEICGDVVWKAGDGNLTGYELLPIELVSFEASLVNRGVKLTWVTKSELNNDFFQIQHSINGIDWVTIATIDGAGNSSTVLNYQYTHEKASLNGNYYRLLQVDFDGGKKLFPPIYINNGILENSGLYVFPNPSVTTQRTIHYSSSKKESLMLNVFDLNGQLIFSKSIPTSTTGFIVVNFEELTQSGVYILEIEGDYQRIVFL